MMKTAIDAATDPVRAGQTIEGFTIDQVAPLPDLRATAIRIAHPASGARILHLHAPGDNENAFAVTFPTPPPDDTGLPHILEHAVLGGSRKFPVREPFFEMLRMSLATFINAMTSQAYTVYPVSSTVKKDFFNLVDVYLDAIFNPLLTEDIFRREGHHLTLADNLDLNSALTISGIVYSEMKGASSMPEQVLSRLVGRGLYPDTPLGRDAGGNPDFIPNLAYSDFKAFHRDYYHPGNALIFIYGDIPTVDHLRFLAPVLAGLEKRADRAACPRQPRWHAPRGIADVYPVGRGETVKGRTFITLNWLVGDALDPDLEMDWRVLAALLFGNDAAPLRKALIDSKLGEDTFFCGAWGHAHEAEFHVGIKGSEPERADAFEQLVHATLASLAAVAFDEERVAAAFQQIAYETLEVNAGFPLQLLFAVNAAWAFNGDPLSFLTARRNWESSRARYDADPRYFNRLIGDGLLHNPHRLRVVLGPDPEAQARTDTAFGTRMTRLRAELGPDAIASIAQTAVSLAEAQGIPNTPEALARLPQLKTGDLPVTPQTLPTVIGDIAGVTVLRHDIFANGVNYLEIDMDLAGLPAHLYRWLPRFAEAIAKLGAAGQDFSRIAERRAGCTGGLWAHANACLHATDPDRTLRRLRFGLKTLDGQAEQAFELLEDLVFAVDPYDVARLRDVVTQTRAGYRTALVNSGSETARRQAARGFSLPCALDHLWVSPEALRFIEMLAGDFDTHVDTVTGAIVGIRDFLVNHATWTVSFTGSESTYKILEWMLERWSRRRACEPVPDVLPAFTPYVSPPREGLAGEMKVSHCHRVMPAPHLSHPAVPVFRVGTYLCNFDYFLPEIRFKGNAYGAGIRHDDTRGILSMSSFNDPHIVPTLAVFDRLRAYVAAQQWSRTDIDRAIIGSVKDVVRPLRPAEATGSALTRHIRGDHADLREVRYAATLRATPKSVKETLLEVLDTGMKATATCVVSSRENLESANRVLGEQGMAISDILP